MANIRIPLTIDDPPHLLLWRADEMAPVLLGLTFGVLAGEFFVCTALGVVLAAVYRKYRDNYTQGYFLHMLYYAGFYPSKARSMMNPYIRRFLP